MSPQTHPSRTHITPSSVGLVCVALHVLTLTACHFEDALNTSDASPDMASTITDDMDVTPQDTGADADIPFQCSPTSPELCDGLDNNCNELVDEGCPCNYLDKPDGICGGSVVNELTGLCDKPPVYSEVEDEDNCDRLDNNCDGQVDEGCVVRYKDIAAGIFHVCKIRAQDSGIECTGRASFDRLQPPTGQFESVVVGLSHSCALDSEGVTLCWGRNDRGESTPPANTRFRKIAATSHATCGVTREEGKVLCWGHTASHPFAQQDSIPIATDVVDFDISATRACLVNQDLSVTCWGNQITPNVNHVKFDADSKFLSVSVEDDFTCGLRNDGKIACWGNLPDEVEAVISARVRDYTTYSTGIFYVDDVDGELFQQGVSSTFFMYKDIPGASGGSPAQGVQKIITSNAIHCMILDEGKSSCWGRNDMGQIQPHILPNTEDLFMGTRHFCVNTSAKTRTCFANYHPDGVTTALDTPVPESITRVLAVGPQEICGVDRNDLCACWGINEVNDDDTGNTIQLFEEGQPLHDTEPCQAISAEAKHICMLSSNGNVICTGSTTYERRPTDDYTAKVSQVATSRYGTCVLTESNEVRCFGQNSDPKNNGINTITPTHTVQTLTNGTENLCVLDDAGTILCTGNPTHALITQAPQGSNFTQLVMGAEHACALDRDNQVTCWGGNQLGEGTSPTQKFKRIAASHIHSCGITLDDTHICW